MNRLSIIVVIVVATLLVGGAAFAFANNGNTYTGCLDPGGTIIHVAIGNSPAKECAPSHIQISWNETGPAGPAGQDGAAGQDGVDGADGADGVSGYEIKRSDGIFSIPAGGHWNFEVYCSEGKKILGGGVNNSNTKVYVTQSTPVAVSDPNFWKATLVNPTGESQSVTAFAFAICADVQP